MYGMRMHITTTTPIYEQQTPHSAWRRADTAAMVAASRSTFLFLILKKIKMCIPVSTSKLSVIKWLHQLVRVIH
jgi:hypothetical protein